MKKINKISIVFLTIVILFGIYSTNISYSAGLSDMMGQASKFISEGKKQTLSIQGEVDNIAKEFIPIGQLLTMIGAGVMVAVTTYMGIKYLVSGPEAQGKLKQQLIGVVVSGVVVFGAYGIWKIVINIAKNFD